MSDLKPTSNSSNTSIKKLQSSKKSPQIIKTHEKSQIITKTSKPHSTQLFKKHLKHSHSLFICYIFTIPSLIHSEGIGKHNVNQAVKWCKDLAANGGNEQKIEKCHRFLSRIEQHKSIMDKMVCNDMVQQAKRGKQFDQQAIDKCKRVLAKSEKSGKGGGGKGGGKSGGQGGGMSSETDGNESEFGSLNYDESGLMKFDGANSGGARSGGKGKSARKREFIQTSSKSIMEALNIPETAHSTNHHLPPLPDKSNEMLQQYHQQYKDQFSNTRGIMPNYPVNSMLSGNSAMEAAPSYTKMVEADLPNKDMRTHCNKLKDFLLKRGTHLQKYESDAVDQCQDWRNQVKASRKSKNY